MTENSNSINIIIGHKFGGILSVYETLVPFLNTYININIITLNKSFDHDDPFFTGNKKISLDVDPPLTGIRAIRFIYRLYKASKKYNLNKFIVNNSATATLIYLSSFFIKIEYFIHLHEPISSSLKKKKRIKREIFMALLNKTYRKSLGVICNSKSVQNDMLKYFPMIKTKLIFNPIPISKLNNCSESNPFLDENSANCIFVTVGRLTEAKDYNTLIKACINLKMKGINSYKVYIVGDGDEFESLKLFVENCNLNNNISLIGYKENPVPYIKYCECYLSTSKWEGFGLTIAYAMFLRKPIIASKTGGALELLHKGNTFFDIGNYIDLSIRMEQFIKTRNVDQIIIQKNFLKTKDFDPINVSSKYIKYINNNIIR